MMDISELAKALPQKMAEAERYIEQDLPDEIGVVAVEHFKENFRLEGYVDELLQPWQEVKRRAPSSPWFGRSGQTGKYRPERASAPILHGETRELANATRYTRITNGVRILNEKPYAAVHNEGLPAKVFGKTPFTMPKRPFIGPSKALFKKLNQDIKERLMEILKR